MHIIRKKDGVIYAKYESEQMKFGDCEEVTAEEYNLIIPPCQRIDGKWEACDPPVIDGQEAPYVLPSPSELREEAYQTMTVRSGGEPMILWEDKAITVDQANDLWLKYSAEGNEMATELSTLIVAAKGYIRQLYPDQEEQ